MTAQAMLRKLLITVTLVTPLVSSTHAADMRIEMSELLSDGSRAPGVHITGDIVRGDYVEFKRIADRLPDGIVVLLKSHGGLLVEGLNIGTTIRAKGFQTFVYEYCMLPILFVAGRGEGTSMPSG